MILALAGFIYLFLVSYANLNTEPFLLNVWETHHWPSAFYALFLFLFISTILYKKVNHLKISDFIAKIGSYSYEIFICQMFIFTFLGWDRLNKGLAFIDNLYVRYTIFVIVTTCFSIAPIYI